MNQIIIENDQINWTYERRLKLESKLLLLYYPAMCMDMSPVAGLTVQLQHQMLSCRRVELNPLKKKQKTAKFECVAEDVSNDTFKQLLLQSKFSDVPRDSSKILVCFVCYILFKKNMYDLHLLSLFIKFKQFTIAVCYIITFN